VVAMARKDDHSRTAHSAYMVVHSSGDVRVRTIRAHDCLWVCGVFAEDEVKTMLHNMLCKHGFV
jgi:hypothetical protein